ncbi:hypothetical protein [Gemella sp. zg-1178]|uniref:hypothetical protein n=1 Tax=Gemella sp. zg-1178 TaxID=2840372 RepID=UPI00207B494C|nr:hypothetical protein [Gemella sp. zg-1178]
MFGVIVFGKILLFSIYLEVVQLIGAVRGSIVSCFEAIVAIIFFFYPLRKKKIFFMTY